jgi:membrane protein YdbS with pleckstrin-like domain
MDLAATQGNEPAGPLCFTCRLSLAEYGATVARLSWNRPMKIIVVVTGLATAAGIGYLVMGHGLIGSGFLAAAVIYAAMIAWALFIRPGWQYRRWSALREE